MRQDEDLWMKKMREALKDYSEPPAPDGWDKLEEELSPVVAKRIRPYVWWTAAAVIILAVSGISLFFIQSPTADDIRHTMPPTLAVTPDAMPATKEPETLITQAKPEEQPVGMTKPYVRTSGVKGGEKTIETIPTVDNGGKENVEDDQNAINKEGLDKPSETIKEKTDKENKEVAQQPDKQAADDKTIARPSSRDKWHLPVTSEKKHSSDGKWSIAASFSNAAGASTNQTQDYLLMADMSSVANGGVGANMISVKDKEQLVFEGGIPYLKQSAVISEIKHKQPISFGLSVRKNLSNGFSVESGVTYTMLSSEGKSVNDLSQKVEQKLHYIGIPIRGNWNFVDSKRFTVYLTAGGMVEKCVYGKVGSDKQTVKPLQFSLAGGVGGQLNITNRIGIYVEPGVSYFFDDGSDVETIRKENPLNFNLQGGIRFTY